MMNGRQPARRVAYTYKHIRTYIDEKQKPKKKKPCGSCTNVELHRHTHTYTLAPWTLDHA